MARKCGSIRQNVTAIGSHATKEIQNTFDVFSSTVYMYEYKGLSLVYM